MKKVSYLIIYLLTISMVSNAAEQMFSATPQLYSKQAVVAVEKNYH